MTAMAEMKFIENKLQSFDINTTPSVTHTQIEKLKKVCLQIYCLKKRKFCRRKWIIRNVNMK